MNVDSGTRALVTGASKGIGRAIAESLAARGAHVGLLARDASALDSLASSLPGEHTPLPADITDRDAVAAAVASFGAVDLLVANAGIANYGRYLDQSWEAKKAMVDVNVLGTMATLDAALPGMVAARRGHVVIVSSGAGIRSFPEAAVYGGTKMFDKGLASALRHELAGTGVSLTTVYPGEFHTSLHDHERESLPAWRNNDAELPPSKLADAILAAVEKDRREVHMPGIVRLLALNDLMPGLVDLLLRRIRGASAAPRR